jgi:hypothetical protein
MHTLTYTDTQANVHTRIHTHAYTHKLTHAHTHTHTHTLGGGGNAGSTEVMGPVIRQSRSSTNAWA